MKFAVYYMNECVAQFVHRLHAELFIESLATLTKNEVDSFEIMLILEC